jgi:hypothetical protein
VRHEEKTDEFSGGRQGQFLVRQRGTVKPRLIAKY